MTPSIFYFDDEQHKDLVKQNALKRRAGRDNESSSDDERKDEAASSSNDMQRDIVQPQTIVSTKRYPDEAHQRFRKCTSCFIDNIISNVNCEQCGRILIPSEQASKTQDAHIEKSQVSHSLKIAVRNKPRGDYFISESKRAKQYLDRAIKAGYASIVEHMTKDPQRAIDCKVGTSEDCTYTLDDMKRFDMLAIEETVIKTRPYSQRQHYVGTERVMATSKGGSETYRFRADPVVAAKAKLMEIKSKPPAIRTASAGGNAVPQPPPAPLSRSRSATIRLIPANIMAQRPTRSPPRTPSMGPPQFVPRQIPIGGNPKHYSMANPPPPPTPRQVSTRLPSQPRPKPKGSPPPPPAPKRRFSQY